MRVGATTPPPTRRNMLGATPVGGETKTKPKTRIHTGTMNVRLSKMAM